MALLALCILLSASRSTTLLQDTDTRVMLSRIMERENPLSWFTSDWPLQNHFYRPIVTLIFEADLARAGWNSQAFAFTNALLCAIAMITLFWCVREVFENSTLACLSALIYTLSICGVKLEWLTQTLSLVAGIAAVVAVVQSKKINWLALSVFGIGIVTSAELFTFAPFSGGVLHWIPGRTATTMACFCFAACAAYARYERLSASRIPAQPQAGDPPSTRNTEVFEKKSALIWAILSVACVWLALASYEQAVMLPACLLGIAITMRNRRILVRWAWQIPFWGMIGVYWLQRKLFLPPGVSTYQNQQFRNSSEVFFASADYFFHPARAIRNVVYSVQINPLNILFHIPGIVYTLCWIVMLVVVYRMWKQSANSTRNSIGPALAAGYILSSLAFLPMAWMKPFDYNHYHFWPQGFRAIFAAGLLIVFGTELIRALSRPALQAPPRPSPAPGSLPRP